MAQVEGIVFVHVPRTGGTSIRHALRMGTGHLHLPARDHRDRVGRAAWEAAFTFGVVRNPWTRALSLYWYLQRGSGDPAGFRRWVREGFRAPRRDGITVSASMASILAQDRELLVDRVLRFERLGEEWREIRPRIAARWPYPVPEQLPHVNAGTSLDLGEWYDAPAVEWVRVRYREDLDLFGYQPPDSLRHIELAVVDGERDEV